MSAIRHNSPTQFARQGKLQLGVAALLASLFSGNIYAQTAEQPIAEENWYQVELVVFKRVGANSDLQQQELWPHNITLSYPPRVQFLTDPNKPSDQEILTEQEYDADENTSVAQTSEPNSTPVLDIEQPYVYLSEEHDIIENLGQLTRRRDNKILFHQTWAQPMLAFDDAPAIIIRGGETFGEHSELEGSIILSISRYLHIHTNLWLTDFEPNYGQQPYDWPALPLLPVQQIPSTLDQQGAVDAQEYSEPTSLELTASQDLTGFNNLTNSSNDLTNSEFDSVFERDNSYFSNYANITQQPFLAKRVVTLTQKRRMRSNELHYIDHPLMGIVIKLQPYTPAHLKPEEDKSDLSVTAE